jgi:polyhydroxybutyrate depolymerase
VTVAFCVGAKELPSADHHAADARPDAPPANGVHVQRFTAQACAGGSAVVFIQIDGGGHQWSTGATGHGLDAAEITWQFLAGHAR